MKKFIPTYIIIVLFAGILIYYQITGKHERPEETTIFKLEKKDFRELSFNSDDNRWKLIKDGEWEIVEPKKWEADQEKVENIVDQLSSLEAERVVEKEPKEIKKYGLDKPSAKISFQAGDKHYELLIGKRSPVSYQFYVKRADSPVVYIVSGYTIDDFKTKPEELRERKIIKVEKEKVKKLALISPERKIVLEKKNDKWEMTSPIKTKGDKWEIENLIDTIKDLKAKKFIEDEAKDLTPYGLDKPSLKVEMWLGEDLAYKSLSFGKNKDDIIYVMRSGKNVVYGVDKKLEEKINKDIFTLRDKNMLPFEIDKVKEIVLIYENKEFNLYKEKDTWKMKKPEEKEIEKDKIEDILWIVKDLEARSFVEEKGEKLDKYGLTKPHLSLILTTEKEKKKLHLGKEFKEKEEERVYAKVSDKPQVFSVDKYILEDLKDKMEELLKKRRKGGRRK